MFTYGNTIQQRFESILERLGAKKSKKDLFNKEAIVVGKKKEEAGKDDGNHHSSSAEQQLNITQYPICMALLFILTLEAILVATTESFVIFYHSTVFAQCKFSLNTLGLAQADLIYHGIYIISPIYQLFLYLEALRQRNILQLFTVLLFGLLMVIFSGIQTIQHLIFEAAGCDLSFQNGNTTTTTTNSTIASQKIKMLAIISNSTDNTPIFEDSIDAGMSNIRPFEYSSLAVVGIGFIILLGCAIKLYHLFKWKSYSLHTFSSDTHLRNAIIAWSILSGLLKVTFFYTFVYAMQLVPAVLIGYTNVPAFECIIVFAVGLVAFLLAIYSVRNENIKTLALFDIILFGSIGYFGYRLYTFGLPRSASADPFMLTRYNLLFTTLALTLLVILALSTSLVCIRNIVVNKVRILENFKCVCPTCYMHPTVANTSSTTLSTVTSFSSALSSTSMSKESIEITSINPTSRNS